MIGIYGGVLTMCGVDVYEVCCIRFAVTWVPSWGGHGVRTIVNHKGYSI